MISHFDTLIAPRQKGERLLRKKTSMVTTQSFVLCEKNTRCDRPTTWYVICCKQMTALHGGCSLSGDRGKSQPHKCCVVNRMCATLRLNDITQSSCIDWEHSTGPGQSHSRRELHLKRDTGSHCAFKSRPNQ
jgi:hypothetical protein